METRAYPVHEVFSTFQGEGSHAGRAAFFIRLYGCPLHCPWCDSAGTWHKDYVPGKVARRTARDLAEEALASRANICVVTGGEPCIHDLEELTFELSERGLRCHLETSGAFELTGVWDWVTCSPKDLTVLGKPARADVLADADELKIIVDNPEVPELWVVKLGTQHQNVLAVSTGDVWLHPEWSQRENPAILNAIAVAVKAHPTLFRAGWQMHKNYRVDALDARSAKLVPLGGDLKKGF